MSARSHRAGKCTVVGPPPPYSWWPPCIIRPPTSRLHRYLLKSYAIAVAFIYQSAVHRSLHPIRILPPGRLRYIEPFIIVLRLQPNGAHNVAQVLCCDLFAFTRHIYVILDVCMLHLVVEWATRPSRLALLAGGQSLHGEGETRSGIKILTWFVSASSRGHHAALAIIHRNQGHGTCLFGMFLFVLRTHF